MTTHNTKQENQPDLTTDESDSGANEKIGFYYSTSIKITDPNSGEVIMHIRGD